MKIRGPCRKTTMSNLGFEDTDTILTEDRLFAPSHDVVENANILAYMKSKGFTDYEAF
jgi:acetyl-CoA synthetase